MDQVAGFRYRFHLQKNSMRIGERSGCLSKRAGYVQRIRSKSEPQEKAQERQGGYS
jgi:hypothetical protein